MTRTQSTETLVGIITRPVTFTEQDRNGINHPRQMPAGTEVYVTRIKTGTCRVRVCGTLLEQTVTLATTVEPA